jgi:hypothetical protein
MNTAHSLPVCIEDCHQLLLWLIPLIDQLPRQRRFTLGERIERHSLHVLQLLTQAAYQRNKAQMLEEANAELAVVRHLWRLTFELKHIALPRYQHGAKQINHIGQQIGAWKKAHEKAR